MRTTPADILERLTRLCGQVVAVQHELVNLRWLVAEALKPETKKPKRTHADRVSRTGR